MNKTLPFLAAAVLFPVLLTAQQKKLSLDQVTVTANKFGQKASATGKVVTVITARDLEHNSGRNLGEILDQQAAITVNGSAASPGTNQTVYLRGADPKYTLILIDGVPVSDVSYNDYKFDLNLIPVSSIERIEIMRGGYASLYGSGAAAGVINIITKKGGEKRFNAHAGLLAGSYGTLREQAGISGRLGHADYNLQAENLDSRGFSSAVDTTGRQGFDRDGFHRRSLLGSVGLHLKDNWTIRPFVHLSWEKGDLDADAYTDDKDYTYRTAWLQAGLTLRHTFEKGDLTLKYNFSPTGRRYLNDSLDGSAYTQEKYASLVHEADLYLHFRINNTMSFLAGNSMRTEKTGQDSRSIGGYSYTSKLSGDSAKADMVNLYGSLFIHTSSGLHIELGGRLNQHKIYGLHPVFSFNPSWLMGDRTKIFLNIASSFTSPSLYQLYSIYGNRSLKPETGLNYEAGAEMLLAEKKLKLRLTGYDRSLKHVIAFQGLHYVNYDRQSAYGGEAEVRYAVSDRLQIKGFYAFADGKVTTLNGNTKTDTTYNNLFKRPENSAGLSVGWQPAGSLYLSAEGKYTGMCRDLAFIGVTEENRRLDPYVLVNIYVQYTWEKRYRLFVSLNNVTDSHYTETTGYATKGFNFSAGAEWTLF